MSVILISDHGAVRIITLDRPEKRNALNDELIAALKEALETVEIDAEIRAVVIRGAGKDFCSGADLSALQKIASASYEENLDDARSLGELFKLIRRLRVPVIAAVHGRAFAGGCGLAMACDVLIADENAKFGYPEVKIGFVPAMVAAIVRRNVGEKKSFEMLTQGGEFSAREALNLGIVNQLITDEDLGSAAVTYASRYAAVSASAVAMTKALIYDIDGDDLSTAIEKGAVTNAHARMTEDCKNGIAKFLNK